MPSDERQVAESVADPGAIYADESRPCADCGVPTNRVSIGFECPLCLKCDPRAWRRYWRATAHIDGAERG